MTRYELMWTDDRNHIDRAVATAQAANHFAALAITMQQRGHPLARQYRRDAAILRRLVGWYADPRWKEVR